MDNKIRQVIKKHLLKYLNENDSNPVTNAVLLLTKKYKEEYGVSCEYINQGECNSFAEELYDSLKEIGIIGEILSDGLFFDPFGDLEDHMLWDTKEYGHTPPDFKKIGLPSHYWFYYNGKHYDSDAPQGVTDMFELPIIKNFYLKHRK